MTSDLLLLPGIGYATASGWHVARMLRGITHTSRLLGALTGASIIVHAALLAERMSHVPTAPLTGVSESAVLVSLLLVAGYAVTARSLRGGAIPALVLFTAAVALIVASRLLPHKPAPVPELLQSSWLWLHVPLCLMAFILYALAGSAAAVYLMVSGLLKRRRAIGLLRTLPTLQSLERFSHRMAEVGYPLLTAGLIAGMIWADSVWGSPLRTTPKQMVALVTWLVYAAYLHARFVRRMRGRVCAWILVTGSVVAVVGYLLSALNVDPHSFL